MIEQRYLTDTLLQLNKLKVRQRKRFEVSEFRPKVGLEPGWSAATRTAAPRPG
jgi:hypothetical protein